MCHGTQHRFPPLRVVCSSNIPSLQPTSSMTIHQAWPLIPGAFHQSCIFSMTLCRICNYKNTLRAHLASSSCPFLVLAVQLPIMSSHRWEFPFAPQFLSCRARTRCKCMHSSPSITGINANFLGCEFCCEDGSRSLQYSP